MSMPQGSEQRPALSSPLASTPSTTAVEGVPWTPTLRDFAVALSRIPRFQGRAKQRRSGFQMPFARDGKKVEGTPPKAMFSAIGMSSKPGAMFNDAAIAPKLLDGDRLFVLMVYTIAPNAANKVESMKLRGYKIEEVRDYTILQFDLKEYRLGPQMGKQKGLTKDSIGAGEFGKEGFRKRKPKMKELEVGGLGVGRSEIKGTTGLASIE